MNSFLLKQAAGSVVAMGRAGGMGPVVVSWSLSALYRNPLPWDQPSVIVSSIRAISSTVGSRIHFARSSTLRVSGGALPPVMWQAAVRWVALASSLQCDAQ
jgi:hypothetical protein